MNFYSPRPAPIPPHRIPGLFDIPQVGRRRRRAELSDFVESLIAPQRTGAGTPPSANTGAR